MNGTAEALRFALQVEAREGLSFSEQDSLAACLRAQNSLIDRLRGALSGLCMAVENGHSTRQPWNAAMVALEACGPNV